MTTLVAGHLYLENNMQDFIRKYLSKPFSWLATFIGSVTWTQNNSITQEEKDKIMEMLKKDYYIIMTRHGNHLSTYGIALGNFFLTGKFGYYTHVLMNLEDEAQDPEDFRLVEAIGTGVRYATFDQVFGNPDGVALLKPSKMELTEWTKALDKLKDQVGKPYDTLFDLSNDQAVSCVELVRVAMQATSTYSESFSDFEKMISKTNNLTPQMFRECSDFEIAYEVRK